MCEKKLSSFAVFDLRLTHCVTGFHLNMVLSDDRADGFCHDDFNGCLDAPEFVPSGSTRSFNYEICGNHFIGENTSVLRKGFRL